MEISPKLKRPKIHFSPKKGWMNDPNGPVFYKGEYHLFFQHDPDSLVWRMMHWGHAVSLDCMHWKELAIALFPDEEGAIFSGSAFVDEENVTGFGTKENPALLLFYTSHNMENGREMQCLAYSTDGRNFQKYQNNPVIPGKEHTPARDPHVFKNTEAGGYSLCLTRETKVEFYHSENLLFWEKSGEFLLPSYAFRGMIECPCMIRGQKDVLLLSMDVPEEEFVKFPEGAMPHKRLMQYFVGKFDGNTFLPDESQKEALLVDYGEDFYAGTVFAGLEENVLIAWLGNFSEASKQVNTEAEGFKGVLSFPRKISPVKTSDGYRLKQAFYGPGESERETLNIPDGVIYKKNGDKVELIDGCVKEEIGNDGLVAVTGYFIEG